MNNSKKLRSSFVWNSIEKFGIQGFQMGISIVLARLLSPRDYGIIGMVTIFIAISQVFIESGFSKALIFKQNRNNRDFSTIFYFNLMTSLLLVIVLWNSARLISDFYKVKELVSIIKVLSLTLLINAVSITQNIKLEIEMNFKKKAQINFIATIISGILSIILAFKGLGVWALVAQNMLRSIIITTLYFIYNRWIPELYFCTESMRELFGYGYKLLISGLIGTTFNQIYGIMIGRIYSIQELGYYTRGNQFSEMISGTIGSIVQTVTFPLLCTLKDDNENLFKNFRQINRIITLIVLPIMLLLAVLSEPFIIFLLTEKWRNAAIILKWSALGYIFTPLSSLNMNILNAKGRTDLFLKLDLIKIPMIIIMMIVTFPLGIKAFIIGRFICSSIAFFINSYYPGKIFNYNGFNQIKDAKWIICSGIIMYFFVFVILNFIKLNILKLIIGGSLGLIVYGLLLFVFSVPEINQIKRVIFRNKGAL
ncbi:MAG: lipopolysaccharide biosynthesis protein [Cetobacterium sp.]